jgi:hypothetical protein
MSEKGSRPGAAAVARGEDASDWKKQTISIPLGTVLVAVSTVLGTLGGTGVMSHFGGTDPDTTRQLIEMQRELEDLNKKLDEIYEIVDRAHPRFAPPVPRQP